MIVSKKMICSCCVKMLAMDILPLDIQTMINRYAYTTVLMQLLQSYGISLRLIYISKDEQASRLRDDVIVATTDQNLVTDRLWLHPSSDDIGYNLSTKPNPRDGAVCTTRPLWRRAFYLYNYDLF